MKTLKLIIAGGALVALAACAQPGGSGGASKASPDASKRGDAWLGNASSFPSQR